MSPYLQNPHSPYTSHPHQHPNQSNLQQQQQQQFTPQATQSLLSQTNSSSLNKNESASKSPYNSQEKPLDANQINEQQQQQQKRIIQPPTYSSTPQYSLANLQKPLSVDKPEIPGNNAPHYNSTVASNHESTTSSTGSWPPQGLYGSNIDKNLFPLSLTNPHNNNASSNSANTNNSQQNVANNTNDLSTSSSGATSNNTVNTSQLNPSSNQSQDLSLPYGGPPTYSGFGSNAKPKQDCMNPVSPMNDPVSLVAKNQELLRKSGYDNKTPIDYANPDRYKNEAYRAPEFVYGKSLLDISGGGGAGNKNMPTYDHPQQTQQQATNRQQTASNKSVMGSVPSNMSKQYVDHLQQHQQQHGMFGRPPGYMGVTSSDPVDLKSTSTNSAASKAALEQGSGPINPYTNNYMAHQNQQSTNPATGTDYSMGGSAAALQNARYTDLSRQTSTASHQQYIRNFASMMAEMGLPASAQQYSQSMAHQFAKTFHQVTTAALQQFLPGSAMTTTAYSKSSRGDDETTRSASVSASSKGGSSYPSSIVSQTSSTSSSIISQYLGSGTNPGANPSLTSQQQQHMAAYQQKFSEAANMHAGQDHHLSQQQQQQQQQQLNHGHQTLEPSKPGRKSKSSSKKSKQQLPPTSHQDMLMNPGGGMSQSYPGQGPIPPVAHNYPPYGGSSAPTNVPSNKLSENSSSSSASGKNQNPVSGSAFNFTPTPALPLPGHPSGLYGETPNYLEDFRGATNPYYPLPTPSAHSRIPVSSDIPVGGADKTNSVPGLPGNPSAASATPSPSPYHQFLQHPSARTGYPFMNPSSLDPLQQQWNLQREEQLRAQMMLANPYSQSAYPRHLWG